MNATKIKNEGIHYTPSELAGFLARQIVNHLDLSSIKCLRILDPACGNGALLNAFLSAVPVKYHNRLNLIGFETDADALNTAQKSISANYDVSLELHENDFLAHVAGIRDLSDTNSLFENNHIEKPVDVVISNPPYVRTQVLGAEKSKQLAREFGLSGRVDLYHAFIIGISRILRSRGTVGLLTSNRYLVIQSGAATRRLLQRYFDLHAIYDLGDTRLFEAAVLPAVLIGTKRENNNTEISNCSFVRIYQNFKRKKLPTCSNHSHAPMVIGAIESASVDSIATDYGTYSIQRGILDAPSDSRSPWSLVSNASKKWLKTVAKYTARNFGDIGPIRVGIKTTADSVFIRDDWDSLNRNIRPEDVLLKPLITHDCKGRWTIRKDDIILKRVLYTHLIDDDGKRRAIKLVNYPKAANYLESNRIRLEGRKYVVEAGRDWYEIWVPQDPAAWQKEKVIFPDISVQPRFLLDKTGAVVNGDCYWIVPENKVSNNWLYLMLAVGNSTFIEQYYDFRFHNKLYAGRRRFITQYVKEFPLPDINRPQCKKIISLVRSLTEQSTHDRCAEIEKNINRLVWEVFGLSEKI